MENAVNNINIGATNLLTGTRTFTDWSVPNAPTSLTESIDGFTVYHNSFSATDVSNGSYKDLQKFSCIEPKQNAQYTLSFWAKGTGTIRSYFYPSTVVKGISSQGNTTTASDGAITFTLSNTYTKYWVTWTTSNNVSGLKNIIPCRLIGSVAEVYLYGVKFECGNKATDWTPAPEDIESEITILESETKTLKESVSSLQLNSDSINASVKSLQETVTNTTNGLASDISSIQNQVNLAMTANDVKLEIQKEMAKGTNKVTTATGFTFNESGLNISKSDSEMSTRITEDGMKVYRNNDVVLTANNQGVDAKNLHATTYLIIGGNSRMESVTEDGTKRTAVFWIGS